MPTTWEQALDLLDARLHAAEQMVEVEPDPTSPVVLEAFAPPDVDGPLPADHRDRAQAMWDRGERILAILEVAVDQVGAQLTRPARAPQAPAPPSMLDTRV